MVFGDVYSISSDMDDDDKLINKNLIARQIGRAVSEWVKKNSIEEDVYVVAEVSRPTLYVDEDGVTHTGSLIKVNVEMADDDEDDDY